MKKPKKKHKKRHAPSDLVSGGDRGRGTVPLTPPHAFTPSAEEQAFCVRCGEPRDHKVHRGFDFPPMTFDAQVLCAVIHFMRDMWTDGRWTQAELIRLSRSIRTHIERSGPLIGFAYKLVHPDGTVTSFTGPETRALFAVALDRLAILQGIRGGLRGAGGESPAYTEMRFVKDMLRARHIANAVPSGWHAKR